MLGKERRRPERALRLAEIGLTEILLEVEPARLRYKPAHEILEQIREDPVIPRSAFCEAHSEDAGIEGLDDDEPGRYTVGHVQKTRQRPAAHEFCKRLAAGGAVGIIGTPALVRAPSLQHVERSRMILAAERTHLDIPCRQETRDRLALLPKAGTFIVDEGGRGVEIVGVLAQRVTLDDCRIQPREYLVRERVEPSLLPLQLAQHLGRRRRDVEQRNEDRGAIVGAAGDAGPRTR